MQIKEPGWNQLLKNEFNASYFKELLKFIEKEYQTTTVFPPYESIFSAFEKTPLNQTKVVILGQDPYHGIGQANGLSFSVNEGIPVPKSLQNIFKELESDVGISSLKNGDLSDWARQGVLLLNATLTVREGEAGSHQNKGWEQFTDSVIQLLSQDKKHLVFLLWGNYARQKKSLITPNKHLILESAHPSPLAAYRGFFGSKPFSKTNDFLIKNNITPIDWKLPHA